MQRIDTLIEKIKQLNKPGAGIIEADLMLDYLRIMYADLIEYRQKLAFQQQVEPSRSFIQEQRPEPAPPREPTALKESISEAQKTAALPPAPLHQPGDIRDSIGINDKYLFISEIFFNDKTAYEIAIGALNELENIDAAKSWLRQHTKAAHLWKDDNETLDVFFTLLEDFYKKNNS